MHATKKHKHFVPEQVDGYRIPREKILQPSGEEQFPHVKATGSCRTSPSPKARRSLSQDNDTQQATTAADIQDFRQELHMFHNSIAELGQQMLARTPTEPVLPDLDPPRPPQTQPQSTQDQQPEWQTVIVDLPAMPPVQDQAWPKLFKLAKELQDARQHSRLPVETCMIFTPFFISSQCGYTYSTKQELTQHTA
jgi:hypothetical protein